MRVKVVLDNSYNKDLEVNLTLGGVVVRYDGGIKVTLRKHTEKLALTANDSKFNVVALFLCCLCDLSVLEIRQILFCSAL